MSCELHCTFAWGDPSPPITWRINKLIVTRMLKESNDSATVEYRLHFKDAHGYEFNSTVLEPHAQSTVSGDDLRIFHWLAEKYSSVYIDTLRINKFTFSDEQLEGIGELRDRIYIRSLETGECVYGNGDNFTKLLTTLRPICLFVRESNVTRTHALCRNLFQNLLAPLDKFHITNGCADHSNRLMMLGQWRRVNNFYSRLALVPFPLCDFEKHPNYFHTSETYKMDFATIKRVLRNWMRCMDQNVFSCVIAASISIRYRDPAVFATSIEIAHAKILDKRTIEIRHPLISNCRLLIFLSDEYNESADAFECIIRRE